VEKKWLEAQLSVGRSIEAIAREVGRDPSTVSYWVRKRPGIRAHRAPRGARGIDRELLAEIVACELPIRDMADVLGRSATTVRHWLGKHGLETSRMRRERLGRVALATGAENVELPCPRHGVTRHVRRQGGFRCALCRSHHVADKRRRMKRRLVDEAGGSCALCGYERSLAALQFHHVDPPPRRGSASAKKGLRARSTLRAKRRASAFCSARIVTLRSRPVLLKFPKIEPRQRLSCVAQSADPG
jgi:hypothetical protein